MTSTIKVNNIQNQCGQNIINENSNTITIGASGDTIALASGASQTGFGRTGTVDWQTTIQTSTPFTAVSGKGYFINTTSGAITMNLPSSPSVGDIVSFKDYARTFDTNALTVGRGGSNMDGSAEDSVFGTEGLSATLIYMDATKGWSLINDDATSQMGATFIAATGGNSTVTCGDFKIHVFTGPGTFCVSSVGNPAGSNTVDYLVVAGGGGAQDGGGGAGGFRISGGTASGCYAVSPLGSSPSPVAALPVSVQGYSIAVGGGGAGYPGYNKGSVSTFSTITSGGGGAGNAEPTSPGASGGGKGGSNGAGGTGNTPPVSPPQGNPGGTSAGGPQAKGSGGGGAGAAGGTNNTGTPAAGAGGAGSYTAIYNHPSVGEPGPVPGTRYFAGGGGGAGETPTYAGSDGGVGGGGNGLANQSGSPIAHGGGQDATINMGGGGGGVWWGENGNGSSGIVIIRYKFQ